jgi:hypothetical protein
VRAEGGLRLAVVVVVTLDTGGGAGLRPTGMPEGCCGVDQQCVSGARAAI